MSFLSSNKKVVHNSKLNREKETFRKTVHTQDTGMGFSRGRLMSKCAMKGLLSSRGLAYLELAGVHTLTHRNQNNNKLEYFLPSLPSLCVCLSVCVCVCVRVCLSVCLCLCFLFLSVFVFRTETLWLLKSHCSKDIVCNWV